MQIIFSTHNQGKVKEMRSVLQGLPIEILSAEEASIFEDVEEDGETLTANALKKAKFVAEKIGGWAMADDTGFFIDALNGAPGVFASRWLGENVVEEEKARQTIAKISGIREEDRGGYFETVVALVSPEKEEWVFSGRVKGSDEQKNLLSHRGEAFRKLKEFLQTYV
ncbi:MAG: hypothetical protein NTU97_00770 [Candidatus Magasanikbacteria bacterium]|nr:hypothetical protein [Candidatus Magasanikbacteria bacterium]